VNAATGEVLIGTTDHFDVGVDDNIGRKAGHTIYHHVEQLMNAAGLFDHHLYTITGNIPITGLNAGNDFTLAVAATRQLTPVVLPSTTTESKTVTYVSSVPGKATVSNTGLVTGVQAGTTVITVTTFAGVNGAQVDTITVTVTA
jgi:uncharacterized protein YjdB